VLGRRRRRARGGRRRGNRLGWIAPAIFVFLLVAELTGLGERLETPGAAPAPPARAGDFAVRAVDGPSRAPARAPRVDLGGERAEAGSRYTGTAFAIDRERAWITALHVVATCRRLVLNGERRSVEVAVVWEHRDADIALVEAVGAGDGAGGLATRADTPLPLKRALGQGFAFGYPQGRPGALAARFLGPVRIHDPGSGTAAGQIWAVERYPLLPRDPSNIGGISGGPMLGPDGAVEGVIVGNAPRRARAVTVDADYIRDLVGAAELSPAAGRPGPATRPETVDRINDRLRRDGLLAQVVCDT
jgi:hypothetical protein